MLDLDIALKENFIKCDIKTFKKFWRMEYEIRVFILLQNMHVFKGYTL